MVCGHSGCPVTNWIYLFHMSLNVGHIENILFYTLVSILGWCFIASLSTTISSINLCKFFVYVSQKSLWIIGLHFLSFKLVSLCIIVFKQGILSELAYYPTINQLQYVWLLYTLVGILVPLVIEKKFEKLSRLIAIFFRRSINGYEKSTYKCYCAGI